ncbi:MAG: DUF1700 domain-containing protein [Clostridia bacterium]|nr:DUF1700 domain-containing protein [Clostridia bacterium]
MTKYEFLYKLEHALKGLPQKEVNERISFYSEMIDDYMEEGLSEENAIEKIGTVENIASQITEEIPLGKIIIEKVKPKRKLTALEIILLIVGSPIWGALLISLFAVVFSLYACLWAVIVSLWAVGVCLPIFAIACIVMGIISLISNGVTVALLFLSCTLVSLGLTFLFYLANKFITKGFCFINLKTTKIIKNAFLGKGK